MLQQTVKNIITLILRLEAELILMKYKPKIIGVTGNVGKTSTKDAIYAALATTYRVRKSQKSFNSDLGIPLAIIGRESGWNNPFLWLSNIVYGLIIIIFPHEYPEWLVLEVGADRPGDIRRIARWLPLSIAVVTNIGDVPVHVEFFKTKEELAREKAAIVQALLPDGILIVNADDPLVAAIMPRSEKQRRLTYGLHQKADIMARNPEILYEKTDGKELPVGLSAIFTQEGRERTVRIEGIFGTHHVYTALAAAAVAHVLGLTETWIDALHSFEKAPGRLRLIEGEKETMILDDTYNAAPLAMEKALESLRVLHASGRKIAVLGDMMELGSYTVEAHTAIGKLAAKTCDYLITAGQRAKCIADGALSQGMNKQYIKSFDTASEAGRYLERIIKPGDLILIKGSQAARMERVVKEIMAHPEQAEKLLVRQEEAWKRR